MLLFFKIIMSKFTWMAIAGILMAGGLWYNGILSDRLAVSEVKIKKHLATITEMQRWSKKVGDVNRRNAKRALRDQQFIQGVTKENDALLNEIRKNSGNNKCVVFDRHGTDKLRQHWRRSGPTEY